jgi:hypothetical protein
MGAENLAPTGIGYPDRPARREWLYRMRYPCIIIIIIIIIIMKIIEPL